jgi:hypothetical protein
MMKFRIEDRLPLALFRNVSFIYAGPDLMSFPLGMISSVMDYDGRSFQRFHPMTVSKVIGENTLTDQMFCFSFFYIDDEGEIALFLTHPYWFDRSDSEMCLHFFLNEIEELAKSHHCKRIKLEFHDVINSVVSFPNSLSHFSYDLIEIKMETNEQDMHRFQQNGFMEKNIVLCYEQSVQETKEKMKKTYLGCKDYTISNIDQSEFMNLERKMDFEAKSYSLSNRDLIVSQRFIPYFKDAIFIAHQRSKLFGDSSFDGFLRWSPNFLEPSKKHRSPVPYLFPSIRKDSFKYGNIFSWALRDENDKTFLCLLSRVISSMKQNGLENCQIAFVDSEQNFIKNILERYGFKKIHTMKILEKRVN